MASRLRELCSAAVTVAVADNENPQRAIVKDSKDAFNGLVNARFSIQKQLQKKRKDAVEKSLTLTDVQASRFHGFGASSCVHRNLVPTS